MVKLSRDVEGDPSLERTKAASFASSVPWLEDLAAPSHLGIGSRLTYALQGLPKSSKFAFRGTRHRDQR